MVSVRTDTQGNNPRIQPFITGFLDSSVDRFSGNSGQPLKDAEMENMEHRFAHTAK